MKLRDKAVYATSALLYSGPLYAGLAGHGLATVPLFAAVFAVWLFVVRPGDWPRYAEDWRHPRMLAWPILIVAVQIAVIALCLAIGRAIGGLLDIRPPLPLAFTFLISLLAIALARLLQRPDAALPRHVPGESLAIGSGILAMGRPELPGRSPKAELVAQIMAAVAERRRSTPGRAAMMPTAEQVESAGIGRQVVEAFDAMEPQGEALALLALIALRPGVARDLEGSALLARTIERVIGTGDHRLIEATAVAALTLLTGAPDTARQFPASARIAEAAAALEPAGSGAAHALDRLARVLERNGP